MKRLFFWTLLLTLTVAVSMMAAHADILYSENFESGEDGQFLMDPPYSWTVPTGWNATTAVVTSSTNFAPSLALFGRAFAGDYAYIKLVPGITSGNTDKIVLSAKVWTDLQSEGGTADAGVGFSLAVAQGGSWDRGAYLSVTPDSGGTKQRWLLSNWMGASATADAVTGKNAMRGTVKVIADYNRDVLWAEVYDLSNNLQWTSAELSILPEKAPDGVLMAWDSRGGNTAIDIDDIVLEHISLVPPVAPTNLHTTSLGAHSVSLAWTDASGEEGYKVYRSKESDTGPWVLIETLPANTTEYTDATVVADTNYWFKAQAFNSSGAADSNIVQAKTLVSVPKFVTYQGKLTSPAGAAVADGNYTFIFGIFDVETGGTAVWTSASTSVAVSQGLFTTKISDLSVSALPADANLWLELTINGETQTPRIPVGSDFFAIRAGNVAN